MKKDDNIRHFKFEYKGKPKDAQQIIATFNAYIKAVAENNFDLAISSMSVELQQKLQDVEDA